VIREFPENYELLSFFEAEPTILDPGAPWLYNTLDFATTRDGIEVHARIVPSYGDLTIRLILADHELARFVLRQAEALRIICEKQRELLVATFAPQRKLDDFVLQLNARADYLGQLATSVGISPPDQREPGS
jgi:hypothetical protein